MTSKDKTAIKGIHLLPTDAFRKTIDGKSVSLYTLDSGSGIVMQVTNWGGRVVSLWTADKHGDYDDVVLGYENIDRYVGGEGERFLGAPVGRYANRIANGRFDLGGITYQLPQNNDVNCLHGGIKGIDSVIWNVDKVSKNELHLSYFSPDGEEGFPGNVKIKMIYSLTNNNEFKIFYEASTDKLTHVNLSHHSFFNLKGEGNGTAMDNVLTINANQFVPINAISIPLGDLHTVKDTPFDFKKATIIGDRIGDNHPQLKNGSGYDHSWVINKKTENEVEHAATMLEAVSGRVMEVWTDQPGIQFYSSNFFDGKTMGKYNKPHKRRESIALETQKFPDSPNQSDFPSTRLHPGEIYTHTCIYKFKTI